MCVDFRVGKGQWAGGGAHRELVGVMAGMSCRCCAWYMTRQHCHMSLDAQLSGQVGSYGSLQRALLLDVLNVCVVHATHATCA